MLKRSNKNPLITRKDIPEISPALCDVSSVFNPGAVKFNNKYLLLLRVQNRGRETYIIKAESKNGIEFDIDDKIVTFNGIEKVKEKIHHIYDPRITRMGETYYIVFAMDMDKECRLGLAQTNDFNQYDFIDVIGAGDIRNGVLFPEKINGKYGRFDRPNKVKLEGGVTSGSTICYSESEDLVTWKTVGPVMSGRLHYWDELIGSGPAPVKTHKGWLHIYHGVATHFGSSNIYQAGVALHNLNNPAEVISRSRYNILEPREIYELTGQVPNVVFPSGMIVEEYDHAGFAIPESEVLIYYGAADTVVGLAVTTIKELAEAAG